MTTQPYHQQQADSMCSLHNGQYIYSEGKQKPDICNLLTDIILSAQNIYISVYSDFFWFCHIFFFFFSFFSF